MDALGNMLPPMLTIGYWKGRGLLGEFEDGGRFLNGGLSPNQVRDAPILQLELEFI